MAYNISKVKQLVSYDGLTIPEIVRVLEACHVTVQSKDYRTLKAAIASLPDERY